MQTEQEEIMIKNLIEIYNQSLSKTELEAAQAVSDLITKGATTTSVEDGSCIIALELDQINAAIKSDPDIAILNIFHRQNQQNDDKADAQYKWVISQLQEMDIPAIIDPATGNGKGWKDAIAAGFPDKYYVTFGRSTLKAASYQYNFLYAGMKGNFLLTELVMMKVTEKSVTGMDISLHNTELFYVTLDVVKIVKYIGSK